MRKFKKIDWVFAIISYFMLFLLVGSLFDILQDAFAWSISIFIILYLAYWMLRYIKDTSDMISTQIELMIPKDSKNKNKKK